MKITVSEKFKLIFVITISVIFIAAGLAILGYGIYLVFISSNLKEETSKLRSLAKYVDKNPETGITSIFSGLFDIAIGSFGIVVVIQKKRILLLAYTVTLFTCVFANIAIIIVFGLSGSSAIKNTAVGIREAVRSRYGITQDNNTTESSKLTRDVDRIQRRQRCCGWSGNQADNLFVATPWYNDTNSVNNTNADGTPIVVTLPDSCCEVNNVYCYSATDMISARTNSYIFKDDCLEEVIETIQTLRIISQVKIIIVAFAQLAVCIVCTLSLQQEAT